MTVGLRAADLVHAGRERRVGRDIPIRDCGMRHILAAPGIHRGFDAHLLPVVSVFRGEDIERGFEVLVGTVLQRRHGRIALEIVDDGIELGAADAINGLAGVGPGAGGSARPAPRRVFIVRGEVVHHVDADHQAELAAGELIDVGAAQTIAVLAFFRVQLAQRISFAARVHRHHRVVVIERPDGAHVDRAGEAGTDQVGRRRLVDDHARHQFRRILVELDAAVVVGRNLLAAVQ